MAPTVSQPAEKVRNPALWSEQKRLSARLLVEANMNKAKIAATCGVAERTLWTWRHDPWFRAEVERQAAEYDAAMLRTGISRKERRIEAASERWRQLCEDRDKRGALYRGNGEPEFSWSGYWAKLFKLSGNGLIEKVEWTYDAALVRELREIEAHVARLLGELIDRREHGGMPGRPIEVALNGDVTVQHTADEHAGLVAKLAGEWVARHKETANG